VAGKDINTLQWGAPASSVHRNINTEGRGRDLSENGPKGGGGGGHKTNQMCRAAWAAKHKGARILTEKTQ